MAADIGTRQGVKIKDVDQSSTWINGFDWMHQDSSKFPMMSGNDLKLNDLEMQEVQKERSIQIHYTTKIPDEVQERYSYSNYLNDPNRHKFSSVVRIMASIVVIYWMNFAERRNLHRWKLH